MTKEPIKIIMLDIDGVMNSIQSNYWYKLLGFDEKQDWLDYRSFDNPEELHPLDKKLCPMACSNLKLILNQYPDIRIVISSTWRKSRSVEKFNTIFKYYKITDKDLVIDKTPVLHTQRGYEIEHWLKNTNYQIEDFVILDDDSDMGPYLDTPHFIKTNYKVGLDYTIFEKMDKYFGKFNLKFLDLEEGQKYKMYSKPRETVYIKEGSEMVYYDSDRRVSVFYYPEHELFSKVI